MKDLGTGYTVDGYRSKVINDRGEVVATKTDPAFRAYIYSSDTWHDLGEINPSGTTNHRTIATGLNNLGGVIGEGDSGGDSGQKDGFYSTGAAGTISRLNVVNDTTLTDDGTARFLNDLGVIVGSITHNTTNVRESFVFRVGPGVVSSVAGIDLFAINNFGDTLGESGFLTPQQLLNGTPLPASTEGFTAQALNNSGQILLSIDGDTALNGDWGLIYDYGLGKVTDHLPNLSAQSIGYTSFRSINDFGQVVGRGADEGAASRAVFYSMESGLVSLDALDLMSGSSAAHLTSAEGINNLGQIICTGTLDADPTPHLFLLTPDPAQTPSIVAAYDGLASVSGVNLGYMSIKISKTNSFSVKLVAPGVSYSFKEMLTTGAFHGTIAVRDVTLNVDLQANAAKQMVTGTIGDGTTIYDVTALRQAKLGIFTGKYTALLQLVAPNASLPQGIGHGQMSVSKTGSIKITGQLGDGSTYSVAAKPHFDGTWTFHMPLYLHAANPGSIVGTMTFDRAATDSDCGGMLKWNKPGDFNTIDVTCKAALFKAVKDTQLLRFTNATTGAATFAFAGGEQSLATHTLSVSNKNVVMDSTGTDGLAVKLSTSNGAMTGSFNHPLTGKTSFTGVVQQKLNRGAGVFLGQSTAGSILLTPQ